MTFEVGDRVRLKARTDDFAKWSGTEGIIDHVTSQISAMRPSAVITHPPVAFDNDRISSSWFQSSLELVSTEYEESVAILGEEYFA